MILNSNTYTLKSPFFFDFLEVVASSSILKIEIHFLLCVHHKNKLVIFVKRVCKVDRFYH